MNVVHHYFKKENKKKNPENVYFQGWYFKHQKNETTIALIPGYHRNEKGQEEAFIQVITEEHSYYFPFPISQYSNKRNKELPVRIGACTFGKRGISIDLKEKDLILKGKIIYQHLHPIGYDIMGPFAKLPLLQCRHGITSMYHTLEGTLSLNGKEIDFSGGCGYMEQDSGSAFPRSYLWTQCNHFNGIPCSIMASVATVPVLGKEIIGCISVIAYQGSIYRFATYLGAKIVKCTSSFLHIKQGKYHLVIRANQQGGLPLKAPDCGGMTRNIHESASCPVRYRLYQNQMLLFDLTSSYAGFETSHS